MVGACAQDHETAKIRVTHRKVFLKGKTLELYLRGRGRPHQPQNGWKSKKTEREIQDKEYAEAVGVGEEGVTCAVRWAWGKLKVNGGCCSLFSFLLS